MLALRCRLPQEDLSNRNSSLVTSRPHFASSVERRPGSDDFLAWDAWPIWGLYQASSGALQLALVLVQASFVSQGVELCVDARSRFRVSHVGGLVFPWVLDVSFLWRAVVDHTGNAGGIH